MAKTRREARLRRKVRIRQKVHGTAERPRLTVFRSLRHISAQVIDDENNVVLATASTVGKGAKGDLAGMNKRDQAKKIGTKVAEAAKAKGVKSVVFDRNGYKYHGRVLSLASAARESGLEF